MKLRSEPQQMGCLLKRKPACLCGEFCFAAYILKGKPPLMQEKKAVGYNLAETGKLEREG